MTQCQQHAAQEPFDPARLPAPDEYGYFYHPDIPGKDESDDVAALLRAMGFEWNMVSMETDAPELADDYFERDDTESASKWVPTTPQGEGWQLVGKWDTEDGPHAMFVRPIAAPIARYTLSISADSGYESVTEGSCTPEQYSEAIGALHGNTKAEEIEQLTKQRDDLLTALEGLHMVCSLALSGKDGKQHSYFETRSGHFVEATTAMVLAESAIASVKGEQKPIDQCAECRKLCRPAPSLCAQCEHDTPAFTEAANNLMKGGAV